MGTSRTCGPRCHNAKQPECDCWCGGLFHGAAGAAARQAFVREFGGDDVPAQEDESSLFWSRAMAAARNARAETPNPCQPSELVVGEGYAMYLPCPHCGVIHRPAKRSVPPNRGSR